MTRNTILTFITVFLGLLVIAAPSHAIVVTQETSASALAASITAGGGTGIAVTSVTLNGHSGEGAASSGTYTNASGTYGIGDGIILSSGNVSDYGDGANTASNNTWAYGVAATIAQQALVDEITGSTFTGYDVTELIIGFDMLTGYDTVFFNVAWGSDEYAEYIGTSFIDAFGLYVNGTNIAQVGGYPVNVDHPDMAAISGTELDGLLAPDDNPVNLFSQNVGDGSTGNVLHFIIADTGDSILDSTAYISALGGTEPPSSVPEPATMLLLGSGLIGLAGLRRKLRKR